MLKRSRPILIGAIFTLVIGCATEHKVRVEPVEVKPIHITIDVNIRVDQALDNFFDEIDQEAVEKRSEQLDEKEIK